LPQLTPFATVLHTDVLVLGWQLPHGSFGSSAFAAE
jgi:hypothetical protein